MPTNAKIKKIRTPKKKLSNIPNIGSKARKKLGLTGPASNPVGSKPKKTTTDNKKKKDSSLSDLLGAAAELASGGGDVGGVSATSQSYGKGPVPENINPFDEEDTENAAGRL